MWVRLPPSQPFANCFNNMNPIYIPIHSFSDLITNSSSETYVSVTNATVETFKNIINTCISLGGGNQTADELFEFDFCYEYYVGWINKRQELADIGIDVSRIDGFTETIKITDAELELIKDKIVKKYPSKSKSFHDSRCHHNDTKFLRITPKIADERLLKISTILENLITTLDTTS